MDKIKKNIKRIWESKCKYLVMIACALILMNGVNLLQTSLKFLNSNGEEIQEIKSIEIESDDWVNREPGSFHITKSADWTGYKEATIRFDIDTTKKIVTNKNEEVIEGISGADVILVLDTSGSMKTKDRLVHLKTGATDVVNQILSEGEHKIALITFNSNAILRSTFTNDKNKLISQISGLSPSGGTSYVNAYKSVISLLSGYEQNKNRDLVMLFLTDGAGGSAKAQYQMLKDKYNITIVGIQYDMGTSIKAAIRNISDKQYLADTSNIKSILLQSIGEATDKIQVTEIKRAENYETFEIEDYVSKEFTVKSVDDIKVSIGNVRLETESDGTQKIIWAVTEKEKFPTGNSASMTIKATYQGELKADRVYPTNQKESIKTKLPEEKEKTTTSELTPQLRAGYYIMYNPNLPSECNPEGKDMTTTKPSFAYEEIKLPENEHSCSGWQFKGWGTDLGSTAIGDDKLIMPNSDIKISGIWTKVEISKKMEGTIHTPSVELLEKMIENAGMVSVDTGIKFEQPSSSSNGRGLYIRSGTENDKNPIYYYRGAVTNNNVLFAGICWQIVRTTESGGIKLIYNGVSNDGKTCRGNTDNSIGKSEFSTSTSVGYMYGSKINFGDSTKESYTDYYFGKLVTYDEVTGKYSLVEAISGSLGPTSGYHYTCGFNSASETCSTVRYVYYASTFAGNNKYEVHAKYISLTGGDTLETIKDKAFKNINESLVKTTIDSWYKTNIEDKGYTKYLEDVVWCNDRTIVDGGLLSENADYSMSYYGAVAIRKLNRPTANPAVKDKDACPNVNDRFTVSTRTGNGALTYPVGMITADEASLGGLGAHGSNHSDSYLTTDNPYWTMTPSYDYSIFDVNSYGYLLDSTSSMLHKVRPSISLKPGTLVSLNGDGTLWNPYEVVME